MSNKSIKQVVDKINLGYDRCNSDEVYRVMSEMFPNSKAADWTPEMIFPFIPEGACPIQWSKTLRNAECKLNNPTKTKKSQKSAGQAPKGYNPAEEVTRRTTTNHLFEQAKPEPRKTAWEILIDLIKAEEITLWDNQKETIWESQNTQIDIHRNSYGHLRLIWTDGRRTVHSAALAINPAKAAIYDYRLVDNALRKYHIFCEDVTAKVLEIVTSQRTLKARPVNGQTWVTNDNPPKEKWIKRPLWQYRPSVTDLMDKHNIIDRDTAAEMYKMRD